MPGDVDASVADAGATARDASTDVVTDTSDAANGASSSGGCGRHVGARPTDRATPWTAMLAVLGMRAAGRRSTRT